MKLFQRLILRPLRADPTRTVLTILSIALGVAVVIAIELAGDAATGSFESSLTTLLGKVDIQISANGATDETYMAKLSALPVNARFSPVIEQPVMLSEGGVVTLYGIDTVGSASTTGPAPAQSGPAADDLERSAVVSSYLAKQLGFRVGSKIELKGRTRNMVFKVVEVAKGQSTRWVGIDIAAAQKLLDFYGRLDRIEVFLAPGENVAAVGDLVRGTVPESWEVDTPGTRSEENQRMLRAFRWNLRILSYISLLVGAFLIYNSVAVSVVRRRAEIGILRAVGTSARGVLAMFLGEAAMLGLTGSVLGIVLGRALAGGILGMISDTVNALFVTSTPGTLSMDIWMVGGALLTGTGMAVAAALIPAIEASRVAPAEAMRREAREHDSRLHSGRDLGIAAALAVAAFAFCQIGPVGGRPFGGYIATLLAVSAAAMVSPAFSTFVIRLLRVPLKRGLGASGLIAGRSLVAALARTSIVVTALGTAVAMMVSVGIMVGSFRETVQLWLGNQLRADIYLRASGPASAGIYPAMDNRVPEVLTGIDGIQDIDVFRAFQIHYQDTRATFGAGIMRIVKEKGTLRFLSGNAQEILGSLPGRDRAIVSEPFSTKHNVRVGDVIRIPLGSQTVPLTVAGIYFDYSNDRGFVLVDRATLLKYLPDQPVTNIAVYTRPGVDADAVRARIDAAVAAYPVLVAPNTLLRNAAIKIFDRTFAVTYALEAVAILVAMLGAANSLLALVLDRRREIGLIRYLGADGGQVRRMILTEAGLLGFLAGLLGLALGTAMSLILIFVVNKQSFGWTIQFHPPVPLIGGALALIWAFTVLAGVYPARFAAALEPSETIHSE